MDVYIAHDLQPKPLVLLIHGSGCAPVVTISADGALRDTSLFQDLVAPRLSRFHFAIVEKRGVEPLRFSSEMPQQDRVTAFRRAEHDCSEEYLKNVTKQARVDDTIAAIKVLTSQPWVSRAVLMGHSEGTHVVTGVLRVIGPSNVAAAALFASAGPIPFYGGYVAEGAGNRERFESLVNRIRTIQRANDDVMFEGLPARRWKTFWLDSTPIEDVRDSSVPLFVAQGSRDDTTLPADLFVLEAIRQQPSRPIRYVVVEHGNHAFESPDRKPHLAALFDDFVGWAQNPKRETSVATFK